MGRKVTPEIQQTLLLLYQQHFTTKEAADKVKQEYLVELSHSTISAAYRHFSLSGIPKFDRERLS